MAFHGRHAHARELGAAVGRVSPAKRQQFRPEDADPDDRDGTGAGERSPAISVSGPNASVTTRVYELVHTQAEAEFALVDTKLSAVPDSSEGELIARVLEGDRTAGRTLYDAHAPRLFRLVHRIAGDENLAQECTQEAFVRAFEKLADFRGDAALGTWLHRIAVSVTLNALRKRNRWFRREAELSEADSVQAPRVAEPDLRDGLRLAIAELPEIYRLAVVMHDIEGYTHQEIGATLGIPVGTSKARLFTARGKLRQALAHFAEERGS